MPDEISGNGKKSYLNLSLNFYTNTGIKKDFSLNPLINVNQKVNGSTYVSVLAALTLCISMPLQFNRLVIILTKPFLSSEESLPFLKGKASFN